MEKARGILADKKIKEPIGERLLSAIQALGYKNLGQFVKKNEFNKATFYGIVNQNRSPRSDTLKRLRDLGINIEFLFTGNGEPLISKKDIIEAAGRDKEQTGLTDEGRDFIKTLEGLLMRLNVRDDKGAIIIDEEQLHQEIMQLFAKLDTASLEKITMIASAMLLRQKSQDKERERRRAEQERPAK